MGLLARLREKIDERSTRKLVEDMLSPIQDYPRAGSWSDFEMRKTISGASKWLRVNIGEVNLDSGKIAIYSITYSEATLPGRYSIEIEGYKLNRRKIRVFDESDKEKVISEVREKLQGRYDMGKFERVECMSL